MSRFLDTASTVEVDLGPCQCPNTPHERDVANVRCHLSGVDLLAIGAAGDDMHLQMVRLLHRGISSWNLTDEKGQKVPITPQTVDSLDAETAGAIAAEIDRQFLNNELPNGSGARSPRGRQVKGASRTPKTPKTTKPTAPSSPAPSAGPSA